MAEDIRGLHDDAGRLLSIAPSTSSAPCGDGGSATTSSPDMPRHGLDRVDIVRMQTPARTAFFRLVMRRAISIASAAGGRAVVHRGVGDLHAGQQRDLGLEFEQGLQRALRDFRLVGRVGGQEFAALDQVVDAGRDVMPVGAAAEEERHRAGRDVLAAMRRARARPRSRSCPRQVRQRRSRLSAGTSAKRSSISATPMRASISARSSW